MDTGRHVVRLGWTLGIEQAAEETVLRLVKLLLYKNHRTVMKKVNLCSPHALQITEPGLEFEGRLENISLVVVCLGPS